MKRVPEAILNQIKIYANKIDQVHEGNLSGYEDSLISGEDLLLCGQKKVAGNDIVPEMDYILKIPVFHRVNHAERMETAYKRLGMEGIYQYLCSLTDPKYHQGIRVQLGLQPLKKSSPIIT